MIRLIGILTGSALALAAIVIVLGLPELTPTTVVAVPEFVPQPEVVPGTDVDIVAVSDAAVPAATVAEDVKESVADTFTETAIETMIETVTDPVAETVPEAVAATAADLVLPAPVTSPSQNWYAFWSPFRSQIAADGFISELQRTTGLDYRVVKLKPGVYEVAFAYSDPVDRDTKLDRIAAATGLDMSDG